MLKNERGSLLIDAVLAIVLLAVFITLIERAYFTYVRVQRQTEQEGQNERLPSIYEEATRLYLD